MRILLADDHALFREGLALLLERLGNGVRIFEAESASETLQKIDQFGVFDLLLIDFSMPDMDGFDLIRRILQSSEPGPLAVISSCENPHKIEQALTLDIQAFIPKSIGSRELLSGLRRVIAGERWIPEAISDRLKNALPDNLPISLSGRQLGILHQVAAGHSNSRIAETLGISHHTVKFHLTGLFRLLDVRNRTECAARARELGLLD